MPLITIITTIYNGEEFVRQAFANIAEITHPDFQWVIVDDGSDDSTVACVEDQIDCHPGLAVQLVKETRLGRATALNRAVEAADSPIICNQDIDDLSEPDRLTLQADFLRNHKEVGILGGAYRITDSLRGTSFVRRPPTSHEALKRAMAKSVPFAHTISCFRREAWEQVGGYPDYFAIIDLNFWILVVEQGWQIRALDKILGTHHIYQDSFWHRSFSYRRKQAELRRAQFRSVDKLGLPAYYYLFPVMRHAYRFIPNGLRSTVRRLISEGREEKS